MSDPVSPNSRSSSSRRRLGLGLGLAVVGSLMVPAAAEQAAAVCRITGKAMSGARPLPGVAIVIRRGDQIVGATSTEIDGSYALSLPPDAAYRLTAELMAFGRIDRELTTGAPPCAATADLEMALDATRAGTAVQAGTSAPAGTTAVPTAGAAGATATPSASGGRAAGPGGRFETLDVQADANAAAGLQLNPPDRESIEAATRLLLPPGFSTDGPTEAVAMNGNMANVDRGALRDRLGAIGRGEIDPLTGQFTQLSAADAAGGFGDEFGQFGAPGGRGARGQGGRGGGGGRGGRLGGRGFGQSPYQFTANYTYGGSALDSSPYQLREDSPAEKRPYNRNNFSGTVGGPLRIPGVYSGSRTSFQVSYTGNRSANLFDQYATVPGEAYRAGDFSSSSAAVIDPETGLPFPGNRIPDERINPGSELLLSYIPLPNLPGDTRNFHYTTTRDNASDSVNLRVTHTLIGTGRGGRGGARGGGGGGRGGGLGRAGRGGTNVSLTGQVQYRRNSGEQVNVFPTLGGETQGSSLSVPIAVNIQRNRVQHAVNLNFSRSTSESRNQYAYLVDIAGAAGIGGVSTDPFDWGVPNLSFSTFSDLRDSSPTHRTDRRASVSYTLTRPLGTHTLRLGADYSTDLSSAVTNPDARGSLIFTGLYTANSAQIPRNAGLDFADFLLGLPQQASIQYGSGTVDLRGRSFSGYVQDDWRRGGNLTFNLGLRYDFVQPYTEADGQMVNLDAAAGFTAVAPVMSGSTGPFSGGYPAALVEADANNLAPRVGVAWRAAPGLIVRSGYGVSYNSGSYSTIARQLTNQPPFAVTSTSAGTLDDALDWDSPFALATPTTTTNNYGIERNYVLGVIQQWNVDVSKDVGLWNLGAGYIGTKGSSLDMLRAPNRGPDGLLLPDVQAFTWQSSEGRSILAMGTFRIRRRPVGGLGFGASYTLAKSMDDTTATGGRATVAQDDSNLDAEWALSSFDRRHQVGADASLELPFGPNGRWLTSGNLWSRLLDGWRLTANFTWQSGAPYTPTVTGSARDVAGGVNGTLRANYSGDRIAVPDPTIDAWFNTAAFTEPEPGTFGNASRNLIVGPGSRMLNASFSRDARLGGNRTVTITLRANNLLNLVNYSGIDTRVNSPTFGQVTSVQGMRSMQLSLRFRF